MTNFPALRIVAQRYTPYEKTEWHVFDEKGTYLFLAFSKSEALSFEKGYNYAAKLAKSAPVDAAD